MISTLFRIGLNSRSPVHFSSPNTYPHLFAHAALKPLLPTMTSKIINSQPCQVGPSETLCIPKISLPAPPHYLLHRWHEQQSCSSCTVLAAMFTLNIHPFRKAIPHRLHIQEPHVSFPCTFLGNLTSDITDLFLRYVFGLHLGYVSTVRGTLAKSKRRR